MWQTYWKYAVGIIFFVFVLLVEPLITDTIINEHLQ
jgi:hypothetical protein